MDINAHQNHSNFKTKGHAITHKRFLACIATWQIGSGSVAVVMPFIQAGSHKPLAVASDTRIAQFPKKP